MGFWHNPVKEAGGWEAMAAQGMTDEEISIMEKEGYDMSPVRAKKTELAAQDQAEEEAFAKQRKATDVYKRQVSSLIRNWFPSISSNWNIFP